MRLSPFRPARSVLPLPAALLVVFAAAASAQSQRLVGRATDAEGGAVAGLPVTLHQVGPGGGAAVAEAVTRDDGVFEITFTPEPAAEETVYFVLARQGGQMYVGAPFRPPLAAGAEYSLVLAPENALPPVSPNASPVPSGRMAGPGPAGRGGGAGPAFLVFLAVLLLVTAALWLRTRRAPLRRRRMLTKLAELEEERDAAGDRWSGAERELHRSRRADLRARLSASPELRTTAGS